MLKRCLRDFKTKDHLCLFFWPFVIWIVFSKLSIVPPSVGLRLFLFVFVFFIWFWASLHWFFFFAQNFRILWIFLHAPKLCLCTFDDWEFSFMPPVLLGHFQSSRFFLCLSHLPPTWGVILAQVISKKMLLGSKGDYKGYILALWKDYQRWPFFIPNLCI